jgi:hypothetical protein
MFPDARKFLGEDRLIEMFLSFTASSSTLNRSGPGQSRSKSRVRRSFLDRGANDPLSESWIAAMAECQLAGPANRMIWLRGWGNCAPGGLHHQHVRLGFD